MKRAYPVFIAQFKQDFLVFIPDWEIYTEGKSMLDAIAMSRDAIGLKGIDYEDDGKEMPEASSYEAAVEKAKEDTEIFDYTQGILTMVDVDFGEYRRKHDNRMVKKNCTIPYYLNVEAEKLGINFSKLLQDALIQKISS
ncbi:MAG: type II toxin-antitoxin system HicB family antitoxin [Lachnospiraceae bacterium]|nr:type II toxin-antitoxin system HicB family antitoxin [Lachnospiraceae bacterium]